MLNHDRRFRTMFFFVSKLIYILNKHPCIIQTFIFIKEDNDYLITIQYTNKKLIEIYFGYIFLYLIIYLFITCIK